MNSIYDEDNIADGELFSRPASVRNRIVRNFYDSLEWKKLKKEFWGKQTVKECKACGITKNLQVDHIKPVKDVWSMRLDINNLQCLCKDCNKQKGNNDNEYFLWRLKVEDRDRLKKEKLINQQINKLNYIYNLSSNKKRLVKDVYVTYTCFCENEGELLIPIEDWIRIFNRANGFSYQATKTSDTWNVIFDKMQDLYWRENV